MITVLNKIVDLKTAIQDRRKVGLALIENKDRLLYLFAIRSLMEELASLADEICLEGGVHDKDEMQTM